MTQGKLSRRLLLRILLISGALTFVFTSVQVTLDYYNRIDNFKIQLEETVSKLAYGIASAVRLGDTPTIAGVTNPITSFSEKTAIIIRKDDPDSPLIIHESQEGVIEESKRDTSSTEFYSVEKRLEVVFYDGETGDALIDEKVGQLEVIVGMQRIKGEVIDNLLNIITLQFIKTFIASFLILLMLNYFLVKRLQIIHSWLEKFDPEQEFSELQRDTMRAEDELDRMGETVNRMGQSLHQYCVKMQSLVEDKVHEIRLKNEELEAARSELHKILQRKDSVLSHLSDGLGAWLWESDPFGNLISISEECLKSTKFNKKEGKALRFDYLDVACSDSLNALIETVKNALEHRNSFCVEDLEVRSPDGTPFFVKIEGHPCFVDREYTGFTGSIVDTTENIRLKKQAYSDGLTGLPNRTAFSLAIKQAMKRADRHKFDIGVLVIDIDHFKSVNDNFGHEVGDFVLKKVSHIISTSLREDDVVARIGGEEFYVVAPDITNSGLISLAERINVNISKKKVKALNSSISVTVSIGCSVIKQDEPWEDAIKRADKMLYKAKNSGRNRYVIG